MTIKTEAEYDAAQQRLDALIGCLEDTPEEIELIEVQLAIVVWETKHRMG